MVRLELILAGLLLTNSPGLPTFHAHRGQSTVQPADQKFSSSSLELIDLLNRHYKQLPTSEQNKYSSGRLENNLSDRHIEYSRSEITKSRTIFESVGLKTMDHNVNVNIRRRNGKILAFDIFSNGNQLELYVDNDMDGKIEKSFQGEKGVAYPHGFPLTSHNDVTYGSRRNITEFDIRYQELVKQVVNAVKDYLKR